MNINKVIYSIFAISFGAFMIVYGEFDDSPGGQMLGLIFWISGVIVIIKNRKKSN